MCLFFFQAEDGIRDHCVTGVQTCALPILSNPRQNAPSLLSRGSGEDLFCDVAVHVRETEVAALELEGEALVVRSEERRVGKECRSRWSAGDSRTKTPDSMTCSSEPTS